jgi:uncharacterized glyoxalase superfamily protein PhnB
MNRIYPVLKYEDGNGALEFLERAFGFERLNVFEGENGGIAHAELRFGDEVVMFSSAGEGDPRYNQGVGRTTVYLVVDEVDSHFKRAREAGAEVMMEPTDQDYGSRDFAVRDPEGNIWAFGTYAPKLEG